MCVSRADEADVKLLLSVIPPSETVRDTEPPRLWGAFDSILSLM